MKILFYFFSFDFLKKVMAMPFGTINRQKPNFLKHFYLFSSKIFEYPTCLQYNIKYNSLQYNIKYKLPCTMLKLFFPFAEEIFQRNLLIVSGRELLMRNVYYTLCFNKIYATCPAWVFQSDF